MNTCRTISRACMTVYFSSAFVALVFSLADRQVAAAVEPCGDASGTRGLLSTSSSPHAKLHAVDLTAVEWTDGFWADRFDRCRSVTLPRLQELADEWAFHNLLVAAGRAEGEARGCNWQDAWVFKWIESASYFYSMTKEESLLGEMDEMIEVIAEAQEPDGYLATQTSLRGLKRFERHGRHELYTMGHLLTAACIHHRLTGKTEFLDVARRLGDFLHKTYTNSDNPYLINCPLNPSVVMGAVELYRETGDGRYLELANIIIDNRGAPRRGTRKYGIGGTDWNQDRIPLRKSSEIVGHAVFWSYLYAGAADAYMETGDDEILAALDRLWTDLVSHKMHITGGVSPIHKGLSSRSLEPGTRDITFDVVTEAAGLPYQLPNATAYNETCGQIGTLMWNWRMLFISPEARYADIMERTLYNSIISGVELDGDHWSYTNPLAWNGPEHEVLSNDRHKRFDPASHQICCPTNLLRTEASWHGYLYTTDLDGLWVHHYGGNRASITLADDTCTQLCMSTDYPWDGQVRIEIETCDASRPWPLRLRIPEWADGATLTINGKLADVAVAPQSYAAVTRTWKPGDVVELNLPMDVQMIAAHPRLEHAQNHTAVMRGPVVYCLESVDLPEGISINDVYLPRDAQFEAEHMPSLLGGVTVLETQALVVPSGGADGALYHRLSKEEPRPISLRMIPYFAWNNREEPEMKVWLPLR